MTKPLPQRLDDLVNATGLPALLTIQPRRRPVRGLAMVALALGTAGLIVALIGAKWYWVGEAALMVGFLLSVWLPILGPIKPWSAVNERVDEYDEEVRSRAYLAALPAILIVGAFGLAGLPALAFVQHRDALETVALGGLGSIYLMLLWASIPTLHASWQRPPADED